MDVVYFELTLKMVWFVDTFCGHIEVRNKKILSNSKNLVIIWYFFDI